MDDPQPVTKKPRGRANIKDVARATNLAVSTVSKALNGRPDGSDETRELVKRVAHELGFEGNAFAQNLIHGRSNLIAVVAHELASEYGSLVLRGIANSAQQRQLEVLLTFTPAQGDVLAACRQVRQRGIADGAIVITPHAAEEAGLYELETHGFGLVIINPTLRAGVCASVEPTWADGVHAATHHLLVLGHRRIATVAGELDYAFGRERLEGYQRALHEWGIAYDPQLVLVDGPCDEHLGRRAVGTWLDRGVRFSAVVCFNDLVAYGAIRELRARGVDVPRQISVVGFDDLPASRYVGLTTVRQPSEELGRWAMHTLADQLMGGAVPPRHAQLPTALIVRDSTAPPDIAD